MISMVAILFLSAFGTSVISAIIGMAGGVTLLSIMTFFMPMRTIVPIHGAVQLVSNSSRTYFLRHHVKWEIFKWYLIGLPIGTISATYFIKQFNNEKLALALVISLIWYILFRPKKLPKVIIPNWGFALVALVIGFLNPFMGATGPIQASFFLRDDWTKEEIVATKAISQAYGHLLKIPVFLYLSFDYINHLSIIIYMSAGVVIGTKLGVTLLSKTSDNVFRIIYKSILFLASIKLLYRILLN